jgi:hypothetical protein
MSQQIRPTLSLPGTLRLSSIVPTVATACGWWPTGAVSHITCGDRGWRCAVGRLARRAVVRRVDDAVAILEDINCRIEEGLNPIDASLKTQSQGGVRRRPGGRGRSNLGFCGGVS